MASSGSGLNTRKTNMIRYLSELTIAELEELLEHERFVIQIKAQRELDRRVKARKDSLEEASTTD